MAPEKIANDVVAEVQKVPPAVVYTFLGACAAWAARVIAWLLGRDRKGVEEQIKALFDKTKANREVIDRVQSELKDYKAHVAEFYATKNDLTVAMQVNREDHNELKDLILEVRSMLTKRRID